MPCLSPHDLLHQIAQCIAGSNLANPEDPSLPIAHCVSGPRIYRSSGSSIRTHPEHSQALRRAVERKEFGRASVNQLHRTEIRVTSILALLKPVTHERSGATTISRMPVFLACCWMARIVAGFIPYLSPNDLLHQIAQCIAGSNLANPEDPSLPIAHCVSGPRIYRSSGSSIRTHPAHAQALRRQL